MQRFWYIIIGCAVLTAWISDGHGQDMDDGAQLAFEDMLIDDAIEGDLPAMDDDFDFFADMDDETDDMAMPAEANDAFAPGPPPALDEDALLDMLTDWDEDADSPDNDIADWMGEFDATPQPSAETDDDMLDLLGLDEAGDVLPPERDIPVEMLTEDDETLDMLADDPVFEDVDMVALEAQLAADDEAPVAPEPEPDIVAEVSPEPVEEPVADMEPPPVEEPVEEPMVAITPEPVEEPMVAITPEPVEEPIAESEPEPEPEAVAEAPPPYEDPYALDEALVHRLVRETRDGLDGDDQPEGFDARRSHDVGRGPARRTGWIDRLLGR